MSTEADTCRQYVLPKYDAGWTDDQIGQERYFTDGRVVPVGRGHVRKPGRRADYLLSYRLGFTIAVVEAKASYKYRSAGKREVKALRKMLWKYQLHQDQGLFDRGYAYVREYH